MSGHVNTKYCKCEEHCKCYEVPSGIGIAKVDVYSVSGIIAVYDPNAERPVGVDLNCKDLEKAYYESSVGTEMTFEEFVTDVQLQADQAASTAYPPIHDANSIIGENNDARIVIVRLCIKTKWLKIYIVLKI